MKFNIICIGLAALLATGWLGGCSTSRAKVRMPLYDLASGSHLPEQQLFERLLETPIILVGEHHTNTFHHQAQLTVIKQLKQAGVDLAVGLEMFRQDSQAALDQWIAGRLSESEFKSIYLKNWNFPWPIYRDIFLYAKKNSIAMVGLNVSEGITRQVAYHGFNSLSAQEREKIGNISCDVSQEYREFIKDAFGAHAHGQLNFNNFCEAQLIWDTVMAQNAMKYVDMHPEKHMVILAGTGHARKMGIAAQIKLRKGPQTLVILPEVDDHITAETIGLGDADFLFLKP